MNVKRCLVVAVILVAFSVAQTPRGAAPRSSATDYAAHASQDSLQIGASLLTHKEL